MVSALILTALTTGLVVISGANQQRAYNAWKETVGGVLVVAGLISIGALVRIAFGTASFPL